MRRNVLLADEDGFELLTLASALRLHGISVVGEARTSQVAETLAKRLMPDVLLVDISHSRSCGIALCQKFRKAKPDLGIVITTNTPDLRLLGIEEKEIPLGAQVILKKAVADISSVCSAIEDSIAAVSMGEQLRWAVSHPASVKKDRESAVQQFTDSQVELLRLLAEGLSNAEIGRMRFVSEKAVEQMVTRIAQQLSIRHEPNMNLRVRLVGEYYKLMGSREK